MDGFDEDEIARAIAMSLQAHSQEKSISTPMHRKPPEVIVIPDEVIEISDSEDEAPPANDEDAQFQADLRQALQASQAEPSSNSAPSAPAPPAARPGGAFLVDRAQMERERLARQKRLRPDIAQSAVGPHDDEDEDEDSEDAPSRKRQRSSPPKPAGTTPASHSTFPAPVASSSAGGASRNWTPNARETVFWDGEMRQTPNAYVDRAKDTQPIFRLSEVIGPKEEVVFAIVSSYVITWPWLYALFDPKTPVVVVTHDPQGHETIKEALPEWIKVTPFLRMGHGCMHMKFMLLFYKSGRLRIMVSTANLIEHDWRDIENTVWVQDVPQRPTPIAHDSKATDFPGMMVRVLHAVNVVPALITHQKNGHSNLPLSRIEDLRMKWDFSKVKVRLVPSLAGKHEGWPHVLSIGHTGLMKAVIDLNLCTPKGKELVLECQGSSLGAYTTQWINEFHCSARGESAESWLDQKRAARTKLLYPSVKILFPTLNNVRGTALGERGGGTMFCRRSQWQAAKFPRDHFYDSRSKRGPGKVLMHSKMIIATFRDTALTGGSARHGAPAEDDSETEPDDDNDVVEVVPKRSKAVGWAYMGSHNFTPSAWGTLSGSSFNPVLNVTNFELGIVFPLKNDQEVNKVACWERPPKKYGKDDVPWFLHESEYLSNE